MLAPNDAMSQPVFTPVSSAEHQRPCASGVLSGSFADSLHAFAPPISILAVDQAELAARRDRCERMRFVRKLMFWAGFGVAVGVGLAVGYAWSFLAGIPLTCSLAAARDPLFHRLDKAMQIRRFPELATANGSWRRTRI